MSYSPPPLVGKPPHVFLHPGCDEFSTGPAMAVTAGVATSAAWHAANDPVAVPFFLFEPFTIYQLGWYNGSGTMTDSCDVGVYSSTWVRKIATGGTARSGASALQFVDVADTTIGPGRFYLAMSNNGVTAGQQFFASGVANATMWGMFGMQDSATDAYPLPDPLTNMAAATVATRCPAMFIAGRSLV